uniref:Uncharacterized protein n=1 Tax=Panagrolaimus davidi TaxID=227884 RepID=A0A914QUT8_9BILA
MPHLNHISVPWQKMSMEELANLKRKNKLKYCKFDGIPEIFCPKLIVKLIENNMKYNGYLCLIYLEPITIAAADFYEENVYKLVKVKISTNFQIEINYRKYII